MGEEEYKTKLRKILEENSETAIGKLELVFQELPQKSKRADLIIFPDQDGEGTFTVRVSISGPDLFVLNKAIEANACLIEVQHTPNGLEPNVPLMDPFNCSFEVNDALADVVGV